jgi:phage gp45-like
MRKVLRGIIESVVEGAIKRISLRGVAGEQLFDREIFQHYGFTSRALPGAEAIVIREGNCFYVVAEDDRRYRIALDEGEVALYDDQGMAVHLKRNKHLHIYGADKVTVDAAQDVIANTARCAVNASESVTVTSPQVTAVATVQVLLDTPLTTCTGNLAVAGGVSCLGTFGASGGKISTPGDIESTLGNVSDSVRSIAADRGIYNGHTHPGDSGGVTGTPTPQQ